MIKPSERGLLKAAISCLVETRARQERAHMLWVDKKISNEKYIESVREFAVMDDQVNALVDMLTSRAHLSHAEFEKALSIAPNCLKFTPWNTKK